MPIPARPHGSTLRMNSLHHHTLTAGSPTRPASMKHEWEYGDLLPSGNEDPSRGSWLCIPGDLPLISSSSSRLIRPRWA